MAKKATAQATAPAKRLAGKKVALVGGFGYKDMNLKPNQDAIVAQGGTIVADPKKTPPDLLVVGEGRGGKMPAIAAELSKKLPNLEVIDEAGLCRLLMPTRDELLAEFRSCTGADEDNKRMEPFIRLGCQGGVWPDLTGADLRGVQLRGLRLGFYAINGVDLSEAAAEYVRFPTSMEGIRFDKANLQHAYVSNAAKCSFRDADLGEAWMGFSDAQGTAIRYEKCDFRGATLSGARAKNSTFVDCDFTGAKLVETDVEKDAFEKGCFAKADLTRISAGGCRFADCDFSGATLFRADLRNADLRGANLRKADFREANLDGADLSNADVAGANFEGALLADTKVDGVSVSKAHGLMVREPRKPGPHILELARVAAGATKVFSTSAEVVIDSGETARLKIETRFKEYSGVGSYLRNGKHLRYDVDSPKFEEAMLALAGRWPHATLRLDTVKAEGSRLATGKKLEAIALAAWTEAFAKDAGSPAELQKRKAAQIAEAATLAETMRNEILAGGDAARRYSARPESERSTVAPLVDLDLRGKDLAGLKVTMKSMEGCNFTGANLRGADLHNVALESAVFEKADLTNAELYSSGGKNIRFASAKLMGANLTMANLIGADFRNADLTGAKLRGTYLEGADFTGARLGGVDFEHAEYDAMTKWPAGFVPTDMMKLQAPPPPEVVKSAAGTLDFATFFEHLKTIVYDSKLDNAVRMLKAERFQLFSETKEDRIVGIVKSQSSDERVYSCTLSADGSFGCCTQNLRPCGGMGGAVCKHLLVLALGLVKAGKADPATVEAWILDSRKKKPAVDKDAASDLFLRYKGAEAGEVDWRPTETIPEDYYAM
jgi:uncharacterized protein YjbI with pentapeptide repeats